MPDKLDEILDDILIQAESALERRLSGIAIFRPKEIAQMKTRPEVNLDARAFFAKFDKRREEILAADELTAIRLAYNCCTNLDDFYRFFGKLDDLDTEAEAAKIERQLNATRSVRKAIRWVEDSNILKEVRYDR